MKCVVVHAASGGTPSEPICKNAHLSFAKHNNRQERTGRQNLKVLENIEVELTVEVGRAELTIRDLLRLNEGSVLELDRLAGDPLDILVNGTKIAKGEVVMIGERFGIRFGEVVEPEKRIESV